MAPERQPSRHFCCVTHSNSESTSNADPIALGLSGFDPESVAFQAGRVMLQRLHELSSQRKSFAFETTLAARHYSGWIKGLRNTSYRFQLLFLWLRSPDLAIQRVNERVKSGGHYVAEEIVQRRYWAGLKNFWNLYQPLADTWAVYDNSRSGPRLLAKGILKEVSSILEPSLWKEFRDGHRQE
jgi:predicted ABC-type ATPase